MEVVIISLHQCVGVDGLWESIRNVSLKSLQNIGVCLAVTQQSFNFSSCISEQDTHASWKGLAMYVNTWTVSSDV
jgi:hypothetical protein